MWYIKTYLYVFMPNDCVVRLPSRASFSDFAGKYSKEERFKGIEKMREREAVFNDFVSEVRRKEKEESRSLKEKVCLLVVASERLGSASVFRMSGHMHRVVCLLSFMHICTPPVYAYAHIE